MNIEKMSYDEIFDKVLEVASVELTPKELTNFYLNEVRGICNKRKISDTFFHPYLIRYLLQLRKLGRIDNTHIKWILNEEIAERLNENR